MGELLSPGSQPEYDYLPFFYSRVFSLSWQFYGQVRWGAATGSAACAGSPVRSPACLCAGWFLQFLWFGRLRWLAVSLLLCMCLALSAGTCSSCCCCCVMTCAHELPLHMPGLTSILLADAVHQPPPLAATVRRRDCVVR